MAGRITHVPSDVELHARTGCQGMPPAEEYPRGTRWQCDDCLQQYVVVEGSQYNEAYSAWRKLTDANREGFDR